jgi:hypothetical protein
MTLGNYEHLQIEA